jgi:hypothetical protein
MARRRLYLSAFLNALCIAQRRDSRDSAGSGSIDSLFSIFAEIAIFAFLSDGPGRNAFPD